MLLNVLRVHVEHRGIWFYCRPDLYRRKQIDQIWRCGKCARGIVAGYKSDGKPFAKHRCAVCRCKVHVQQLQEPDIKTLHELYGSKAVDKRPND